MLWATTLSGFLPALFRSSVDCAHPDRGQSVSAVASSSSFFIVASQHKAAFYGPLWRIAGAEHIAPGSRCAMHQSCWRPEKGEYFQKTSGKNYGSGGCPMWRFALLVLTIVVAALPQPAAAQ